MFSFLPLPVGADIARPLFRAPILFFLFFEKEKNRRGVRGNSPHAILMMAGKQLLPYTKRILPDWGGCVLLPLILYLLGKAEKVVHLQDCPVVERGRAREPSEHLILVRFDDAHRRIRRPVQDRRERHFKPPVVA